VRPRFVSIAVPILNLLAGVVKAYEPLRDQTPVPKAVIERFEVRTLNGLSPANEGTASHRPPEWLAKRHGGIAKTDQTRGNRQD